MKRLRYKKAFTLIELLVTVAIILLLVVLAIPAFNSYSANNEVSSKAEEIQSILERAYSSAMSPPPGANAVHVWISSEGANGKVVITKPNYSSGFEGFVPNDDPNNTDFTSETVILPSYMYLKDSSGASDLIFCEFKSPNIFICKNIVRNIDLSAVGLDLIVSSDKTSTQYRIKVTNNPFKVSATRI